MVNSLQRAGWYGFQIIGRAFNIVLNDVKGSNAFLQGMYPWDASESEHSLMNGPGLLLAPHLYPSDWLVLGLSVPAKHIRPIYRTHVWYDSFVSAIAKSGGGFAIHDGELEEKLHQAWRDSDIVGEMFEGDMPRIFEKTPLLPTEFPIKFGSAEVVEYALRFEERTGQHVTIQAVGLEYHMNEKKYAFKTWPAGVSKVSIRFGEALPTHPTDNASDILRHYAQEAAELSNRPYRELRILEAKKLRNINH